MRYRLLTTPGFERDVKKRIGRHPRLARDLELAVGVLRSDPKNASRNHNIRKLTDVAAGDGQWRIRVGNYRIRYDVSGRDVVLYTFRHRRDAY